MKNTTKKNGPKIGFMGPKFLKVALLIIAVGFVCGIVKAAVNPQNDPAEAVQVAEPVQAASDAVAAEAAQAPQAAAAADSLAAATDNTEKVAKDEALAKRKEMFSRILQEKELHFSFGSIAKGILGIAVILLIAWLFSTDRKKVNWKTVGMALLLQFIIAFSVLMFPAVQKFFEVFGKCFVSVLGWTKAGADFLFGPLMDTTGIGYIFVFLIELTKANIDVARRALSPKLPVNPGNGL